MGHLNFRARFKWPLNETIISFIISEKERELTKDLSVIIYQISNIDKIQPYYLSIRDDFMCKNPIITKTINESNPIFDFKFCLKYPIKN